MQVELVARVIGPVKLPGALLRRDLLLAVLLRHHSFGLARGLHVLCVVELVAVCVHWNSSERQAQAWVCVQALGLRELRLLVLVSAERVGLVSCLILLRRLLFVLFDELEHAVVGSLIVLVVVSATLLRGHLLLLLDLHLLLSTLSVAADRRDHHLLRNFGGLDHGVARLNASLVVLLLAVALEDVDLLRRNVDLALGQDDVLLSLSIESLIDVEACLLTILALALGLGSLRSCVVDEAAEFVDFEILSMDFVGVLATGF